MIKGQIERQRDLAEAALTRVETERLAAIAERDEARALATSLVKHHVNDWSYLAELGESYPWLKEQ